MALKHQRWAKSYKEKSNKDQGRIGRSVLWFDVFIFDTSPVKATLTLSITLSQSPARS